ncbi:zinc-binding dehydrogenase [Streptomyces antimycoticus]|uniref:zinc-binding dehydrogenase n=1 Tax=Streptomyces antimycoticus TaxID=68175 RepID=UPI0035311DC8
MSRPEPCDGDTVPRSFDRLRRLGATDVIDYRRPARPREVGRTFNAALAAAPKTAATAGELVRPGGRLCSITSDAPPASAELTSTDLYVRPDAETLAVLAGQLRDGVLDLPTEVLPLDEGPDAFDRSSRASPAEPGSCSASPAPPPRTPCRRRSPATQLLGVWVLTVSAARWTTRLFPGVGCLEAHWIGHGRWHGRRSASRWRSRPNVSCSASAGF